MGRLAVTPSVVVLSPESRIANSMEPAIAATTDAVRTAIRKRRCLESRGSGGALSTRFIIPLVRWDSTEIARFQGKP